jgi:hypothetical protein
MPITSQEVGGATFDRVIVTMGGSGALDNIVIPEPAAGVLLMGALFILTASRRKRP